MRCECLQLEKLPDDRLTQIEKAVLHGRRPRDIGHNARVGNHGPFVNDHVVRVRTAGGGMGIGWSAVTDEKARSLVGRPISELFGPPDGVTSIGRSIDLPLGSGGPTPEPAAIQIAGRQGFNAS